MAFGRLSVHVFVMLLYFYICLCGYKYINFYCVEETSLNHGQCLFASYFDIFYYLFVLQKGLGIIRPSLMVLQKSLKQ